MVEEHSFVSEPPEEYICSICSKVLTDPQLTDCCGQHFCLGCLQQWFKKYGKKQCPHCRSTQFTYIVYLPLKRKIDQLDVYCINNVNGCQVITLLSKTEAHRRECEYAKVNCEQGCGCIVLRKAMQDHCKKVCLKRIVSCSYCLKVGPYDEIMDKKHENVCPEYPVGCPRKCNAENSAHIKRKDLKAHEKVCPLQLVPCIFCNAQCFRSSYQFHIDKTCPRRHIMCKHCRTFGPHDEINGSHIAECGDYPVGCPRGCKHGEKLKRKELEQHAMECELEPVKCAFFDAGCRETIPRKDLKEHMDSSMQSHLQKSLELQLQMANDYQKLVTFFTELKGKFDILQANHEKLKDEHDEMKSSISAELAGLVEGDTQMIHTAIQRIKMVLTPKLMVLTEQNPVVLRICQLPHVIVPSRSWSYCSDPLLIDNTYMVKLKLEIQNESCSPSKKGHKYKARAAARNYTATATLYLYHNQCGDGNHKTLDLQKEIHIELKLPTFSSRWTFNLCAWCRESEVGGLTLRDAYGEMEVINIATTQVQACESDITNVTLSLKGHPCCALPRKLKDCDSYVN